MGILGSLFGSKPKPSGPGNMGQYGDASVFGYGNSLGATPTGAMKNGKLDANKAFDWSQTGKPISVSDATSQYGFGDLDEAMGRYKAGPQSTYNPFKFDFQAPAQKAYDDQYALGASDLAKSSQSNLANAQRAIGTKRPGLLFKAADQNSRDIGSQQAKMRTGLGIEAAKDKAMYSAKEQEAQAGEDRGAFGVNQDLIKSYLDSYTGAASGKIGQQAQITQTANQAQDQKMKDLLNAYLQSWQIRKGGGGQSGSGGGLLGTAAGIAGKFI